MTNDWVPAGGSKSAGPASEKVAPPARVTVLAPAPRAVGSADPDPTTRSVVSGPSTATLPVNVLPARLSTSVPPSNRLIPLAPPRTALIVPVTPGSTVTVPVVLVRVSDVPGVPGA